MSIQLPFRYLEPTFFAGLLDDPVLLVRVRPLGSNLLFDCGQIHHLAKRILTAIDAVFVSHTHMDHWMGIDTIIRHLHASSKTIDIFGPPGIADKMEHKLAGYDWNLAEDYWGNFRVHEVYPHQIESHLFTGAQRFSRRHLTCQAREDRTIYMNRLAQVEAETCTHRVDSLIFRISERPLLRIDNQRLEDLKLVPGPWLKELKFRYSYPSDDYKPLLALRNTGSGRDEVQVENVEELCQKIAYPQERHAIGYISDIGFTEENRKTIHQLLQGVQLLICECTFLTAAKEKARASCHLCTEDINQLVADLCPEWFLPMHLSKTYNHHRHELYHELQMPEETSLLILPTHVTPVPLRPEEIVLETSRHEPGTEPD